MRVARFVSAFLMLSLAALAHGQGWPSKPVRIVVNGAPGSTADLIARGFNQRLGSSLGQPVIVDNRVGAGGSTGIGVVAKSAPDGYTLLHSPGSLFVFGSHVPGLDFDITTDIEPIATTARNTILLTARPGLNVSTVGELVALARANPGKLNYGSGSLGLHVATEMMLRAAKARATHVPYKSPPQALNDLMGGQIDFVLDPGIAIPHAKAGKVRLLGAASSVRSQALPDLPTLAEAGVDMDAGMITVIALYGPARLPKDMVARLNAEVGRIMQTPEARAVVGGLGSEVLTSSPAEMAALLRRDRERYGAVIKEANIRIE